MDKGAKDKLAGSPGENGGGQDAHKDLHSRTGRDEPKRKTQERMERRSRKRSSSAGSEKMQRGGDRQGQMERYCSTGQSPQRAVAPTEEERSYSSNKSLPREVGIRDLLTPVSGKAIAVAAMRLRYPLEHYSASEDFWTQSQCQLKQEAYDNSGQEIYPL